MFQNKLNKHIYFDSNGSEEEKKELNENTSSNENPTSNENPSSNESQKSNENTTSSDWLNAHLEKNPEQNPYKQFELELGDVITIVDPTNEFMDNQTFIIEYIDTTRVTLINIDTFKTIILNINEDKTIENGTIEKIILKKKIPANGASYCTCY